MNMIFLRHQFIKQLAIDKLFKILSPQKITNLSSQKGYQIKIKKTLAKHHKSNSKCITHKKNKKDENNNDNPIEYQLSEFHSNLESSFFTHSVEAHFAPPLQFR